MADRQESNADFAELVGALQSLPKGNNLQSAINDSPTELAEKIVRVNRAFTNCCRTNATGTFQQGTVE